MNARYVVLITPADVGARVSVRSRIPAAGGGPSTTDTLGVLESWSGGTLRIVRRDGTTATLREADVLAARRVPPPPPARPRRRPPA